MTGVDVNIKDKTVTVHVDKAKKDTGALVKAVDGIEGGKFKATVK